MEEVVSTLTAGAEWLPVEALQPWDKNPRHNDAASPRIADSIRRFGFVAPIVVWRQAGRMVAGHTRLKAMKNLMAAEPGFVAKGAPGPGLVRVVFHDFDSEADADLYALADNRLGELATWDEQAVAAILATAQASAADYAVVGWDDLVVVAPEEEPEEEPASSHAETRVLGSWSIIQGEAKATMATLEANSFDAILSDPPYGMSAGKTCTWDDIEAGTAKASGGFMGKAWDSAVPGPSLWREALRCLKPGAGVIAFSSTRTYHRFAVAVEDAGFEVRDMLSWLYGEGFPKSTDVSKQLEAQALTGGSSPKNVADARDASGQGRASKGERHAFKASGEHSKQGVHRNAPGSKWSATTDLAQAWDGYGTALKPACEPAVLARKPLDGTIVENVQRWGVGALWIDGGRIGTGEAQRWPANVVMDPAAGALLDEQTGDRPSASNTKPSTGGKIWQGLTGEARETAYRAFAEGNPYAGETGGASRFFYCAKASRREREEGTRGLPKRTAAEATSSKDGQARLDSPRTGANRTSDGVANHHPTVKPVALARHFASLLLPPPREDGKPRRLLVPFSGSGSEVIGALLAGWDEVVGIEREADFATIARARIAHAVANPRMWETAEDEDGDDDAEAAQ